MENEVIIEYDYLFRFVKKEVHLNELNLVDILGKKLSSEHLYFTIDESIISFDKKDDFPKFKKNDYRIESKKVKNKIKKNRL